ncbi:MAG: T9SS type A sorting domain-containing protein [Opitutaceae bacterium]|nr:T9SS type A sorting domain-containing protein [Cytophagales bacterium]
MKIFYYYKSSFVAILFIFIYQFNVQAQKAKVPTTFEYDDRIFYLDFHTYKLADTIDVEEVIWIYEMNNSVDTIIGSNKYFAAQPGNGFVYTKKNGLWKGFYFSPCGSGSPSCKVDDLLVKEGLLITVSKKYPVNENSGLFSRAALVTSMNPNKNSIWVINPGPIGRIECTTTSDGFLYEQGINIEGLSYDSLGKGELIAPYMIGASYEWYLNDVLLSGTGNSFMPTKTGTYKVIINWIKNNVVVNSRLDDSSTLTSTLEYNIKTLSTVSALEKEEDIYSYVVLFPNPATTFVNINAPGTFDYKMEDLLGNVIMQGQSQSFQELNLEKVPAGLYHIIISANGRQSIKRIAVK